MAKIKNSRKIDNQEFGEYIPAYLQNELFQSEEVETSEKPRRTILKGLGLLFGLLLLQIGLFYLLITLTLGFSF